MSEHAHEWWLDDDMGRIGAKCGCGEEMAGTEVRRRLNAMELLRTQDPIKYMALMGIAEAQE